MNTPPLTGSSAPSSPAASSLTSQEIFTPLANTHLDSSLSSHPEASTEEDAEGCWSSFTECCMNCGIQIFVFLYNLISCCFCCKSKSEQDAPTTGTPNTTFSAINPFQISDGEESGSEEEFEQPGSSLPAPSNTPSTPLPIALPSFELPPGGVPFVPKNLSPEELRALLSVQYIAPPALSTTRPLSPTPVINATSVSSEPPKEVAPPRPRRSSRSNSLVSPVKKQSKMSDEQQAQMIRELRKFTSLSAVEEDLAADAKVDPEGKSFKIFELPIEQRKIIDEVFSTLVILKNFEVATRLFSYYPRLASIKSQIDGIHPLRFVAHLLTNPKLAAALFELRKQYEANKKHDWWIDIKNKLVPNLKEHSKKQELDQYLPGFVYCINMLRDQLLKKTDEELKASGLTRKDLGYFEEEGWPLKLDYLQEMANKKKWDDFFKFLGDRVVNKKL